MTDNPTTPLVVCGPTCGCGHMYPANLPKCPNCGKENYVQLKATSIVATTSQPVQEPAGAVEALKSRVAAYTKRQKFEAFEWLREAATSDGAPELAGIAFDLLASLQPVTQAKPDVSITGPGMNASGERVDSANVTQAKSEAVAPEFTRRWSLARDGFGVVRDDENGAYVYVDDAIDVLHAILERAATTQPAVAWCQLTQSGTIAYFDGKPMVMPGPVGNDCHPHPLYTAPQEAVERQPLTPAYPQYLEAHRYLRSREVDMSGEELDHLLSIFGIGPATQEKQHG